MKRRFLPYTLFALTLAGGLLLGGGHAVADLRQAPASPQTIPERYNSARVTDENRLSIEANPTRETDTRRALEQLGRDSGVNKLRKLICDGYKTVDEEAGIDPLDALLDGFDTAEGESDAVSTDYWQGFDDSHEASGAEAEASTPAGPEWLRLSGSAGVSSAVNLVSHRAPPGDIDLRGLSRLRSELDLCADLDLPADWRGRVAGDAFYDAAYALRGREHYTKEMLDVYESELRLGETWVRGNLCPVLDIQIGRQIVVWGKSDNIRVTDVINPLDLREPGMTDIEDLRLPVTLSRLDYAFGAWNLTGLVIHEFRTHELPVYGSDFYTPAAPLPAEQTPASTWKNQELGLALSGVFSGWDLSLYGAYLFDDRAHLTMQADGSTKRRYHRISMGGGALNLVEGNWLFKSEAAWFNGLVFSATPGEKYNRLDTLLGVEYTGITDTTLSLEAVNRYLVDYDDRLNGSPDHVSENDFQWAFRLTRNFLHERLTTMLLANIYGTRGQDGTVTRMELSYDLDDHWEWTTGLVLYQGGDNPSLERIKDNDRLFMHLKYDF